MSVQVIDNFSYKGKKGNFERDNFDTLQAMRSYPEDGIDDGHVCFCNEDGNHYKFNHLNSVDGATGRWRLHNKSVNTLTETGEGKVLDARQGKILKDLIDAKVIEAGGVSFDTVPTKGSTNPVTSNGIKEAMDEQAESINSNTGVDDYPVFSTAEDYKSGDAVNYQGKLYQFTNDHAAGAWTGTDASEYSLKKASDYKLIRLELFGVGFPNAKVGQCYYNTDTKKIRKFLGTGGLWETIIPLNNALYICNDIIYYWNGEDLVRAFEEYATNRIGNLQFTSNTIPDIAKNGIHEFLFYASKEIKTSYTNFRLNSIGWYEETKRVIAQIIATKIQDSTTGHFAGVMITNVENVSDLPSGLCEYNYFTEDYGLHIIIDFDYIKEQTTKCNGIVNPLTLESDNPYVAIAQNTANIAQSTAVIFEDINVDNTDLAVGYFYSTQNQSVGDIHTDTPNQFIENPTSWGCIKLSVAKGSIVVIKAKGGTNGRAYALTDKNRKILVLADANVDTMDSPVTLTVEEDGYLYVNQNNTTLKSFGVRIRKDKITPVIDIVINKKSYDNSALEVGYYYNNGSLSIGEIHPDTPIQFNFGSETSWGCIKLAVYKGSKIILSVKGGTNGRAYALTDKSRKLLALADVGLDTTSSPIILTVEEDGFLYVNQNGTTLEGFGVSIESTIENQVESLSDQVESLSDQVESLSDQVTDLEENPVPSTVAPHMYNPPLNLQKEQLRVLDIGNSYTVDATHYLPDIVTASEIDVSDICLYTATRGGASFKNWFDIYHDKDTVSYGVSKLFGGLEANITGIAAIGNGERFRNTLINNEWDIIIIHQVSDYAPYFDRWEEDSNAGYLSKFIRLLRKHQPKAVIGFLLVHSYWSGYGGNTEKSSLERWKLIAKSAKKLRANYGIDFIIPYGTAIQNLRASSLNNEYDLTADGTHCANGIADYTAACTYFQSLFSPRYGVSVLGNTARISVEQTETYPSSDISVTDENAPICQKAAFLAAYNWYECINPDDIGDEELI